MRKKLIALDENIESSLEKFINLDEINGLPVSTLIKLADSRDPEVQLKSLVTLDRLIKENFEIVANTTDKDHFELALNRLKKLTQLSYENETYCSKFITNNDDFRTLFGNAYGERDVAHSVVKMLVRKLEANGIVSPDMGSVIKDISDTDQRDSVVNVIKSVCPEIVGDIYSYLIECKNKDITVTLNSKKLHDLVLPLVSENVYESFVDLKIKDFSRALVEEGLVDSETGFYLSGINFEALKEICSREEFSKVNVTALHYEIFKQDQLTFNIMNELRNLVGSLGEVEEHSFLYNMFHSVPVVNTRLSELKEFKEELTMMYFETNISQIIAEQLDDEVLVDNLNFLRDDLDTFVLGDVHGHLVGLVTHLYQVGLVDREGNWIGGDKEFIQLGDMVDRWVYSPETLLYMLDLQQQAREAGGDVVILAGNHEVSMLEGNQELSDHPYFDITRDVLIEAVKDGLIKASHVSNGKIYTHAGIHPELLKKLECSIGKNNLTMESVAEELNKRLVKAVDNNDFSDDIFIIDPERLVGGDTEYGGVFWNDLKTWEKADKSMIDNDVLLYILNNQVAGHTFGDFQDHMKYMERNDFAIITMDFAFSPYYGGEQISCAIVDDEFVLVKDSLDKDDKKYWATKKILPNTTAK